MSSRVDLSPSCSLEGFTSTTRNRSRPIHSFLGVPYASPPVGCLRFQPTKPLKLWEGVRMATQYGAVSCQDLEEARRVYAPFSFPDNMSEDCLFLNIWTSTLNREARLPVMIFIHGGSFLVGSSDFYDGTALSTFHDVVVVSLNYRLGFLGFFYCEEAGIHGNMGLFDQIEAMKFVQKFIDCFGGNPDNVTLFGESAGAISISAHILSPLSKGLFHRAICQSGSILYPGSVFSKEKAAKLCRRRLKRAGVLSEDPAAIKDFLRNFNPMKPSYHLNFAIWVIDGTFLPQAPLTLASTGKRHPVEVITGFNQCEGLDFVRGIPGIRDLSSINQVEKIVQRIITKGFYPGRPNSDAVIAAVMQNYFKNENETDNEKLFECLAHIYGDILFTAPSVKEAELNAEFAPSFLYQYHYRTSVSPNPEWCKAKHGDELPFVIGEPFLGRFPDIWSEMDKEVSRRMMAMWTSFARTGKPCDSQSNTDWPEFQPGCKIMYLNDQLKTESYQSSSAKLWNTIVPDLIDGKNNSKL